MESIWEKTAETGRRTALEGERRADVAVIGGGLAGILTAWRLKERGLEAVVLEARRVGSGQTGRTTAKLTAQHGLCYPRLIRLLGEEGAGRYAQANQRAVEEYRALVRALDIPCDLLDCPAWLYSRRQAEPLRQEADACQRLGLPARFTTRTDLPFPVEGAVRMEGQALFHPLKFLAALARQVTVYEDTAVLGVERDGAVTTARGRVRADHVVFACHYPFVNFPGFYFARMHQERSYVVALEGAGALSGPYFGVDPDGLSLRPWQGLTFVGGGNHRTGENSGGGRFRRLEQAGRALWPDSRVAARWSAQDCVTLDGLPYLGRFSPTRPRWYVATGFGKWGMTTSMVAADLIAAQICGEGHPLEKVCAPGRFSGTALGGLARQSGKAVQGLSRALFFRPGRPVEDLPAGAGGLVADGGRKVAASREEDGALHKVCPQCPHLGCQLDWNPDTATWECPCHGSRFDREGRRLEGPAQRDLPPA